MRYNNCIATHWGHKMKFANTLEVRAAVHAAADELGLQSYMRKSWTDKPQWTREPTSNRVVTFATVYADEIAKVATANLRRRGFNNNDVRVTDNDNMYGSGPYIRVNATIASGRV